MISLAQAAFSRSNVTVLFLSVGVLLIAARALGEIAKRLHQPAVLGEILAGILLGPTLLGFVLPRVSAKLFPAAGPVPIALDALTTLAIALFLFVAGMEVDLSTVWRQGRAALSVSLLGMLLPFVAGFSLALLVPTWLGRGASASGIVFALFLATALSISALPVVAKVLMDLGLFRTDMGMVIIAAAILNDISGWVIFAFLLGLMGPLGGGGAAQPLWHTIVYLAVFTVGMLTLGRWLIDRAIPWFQAHLSWPGGIIGTALAGALICAAFTEWIGVHAIFGAFILGVALGDSRHMREQTRATLDQFISFFFAPLFFATIGLRVNFATSFSLSLVLAITAIATAGKVLGCCWGARLSRFGPRESWAVAFGMNARGAMEIILGLLAREAGVITDRLFVALVIMALATSASSGYFIQRILGTRARRGIADFITGGRYVQQLGATDRRGAINELVQLALADSSIDVDATERRIWMHEQSNSNGLPHGVAIPHAGVPGLTEPRIAVGFSEAGIDFNSADGSPARIILLLLTPFHDHKLQRELIVDAEHTFGDLAIVEKALEVQNSTEFLAVLRSGHSGVGHERKHEKKTGAVLEA
jgi:Kef-type K+ transport system membrane component KefB/mannitol/fructose-specific phosphotransferase system IIA component (Ntr-type)